MELILLKDVEKVGLKGDVVRVRDGYGRNFLISRGLALVSSKANRKFVEDMRGRAEKRQALARKNAMSKAEKLKTLTLQIEAAAGEQGKLFGSVTSEDICGVLEKQGFAFTKKQIHLKEPIRALGVHAFEVELYSQVKVALSIDVLPKVSE